MVPPLRYRGKFISQKKYEQKMRMMENIAKLQRLNKERRAALKAESKVRTRSPEPGEEAAAAASPPSSPSQPSSPKPAKKEKPKSAETSKKRGIKRKASPEISDPASKRSAVDKQNMENSPQQANLSSGSARSDE
ncbi:translation initiation factor IF-2-like [Nasonia vitripennis]|uniref:Uncharacterized protein n=1 Tax=Nasonia vitripennis TaxID=7425 RepID=A0A7M7GCB7_NASVI|nr:translation initiation factor IF-2-like [Nasonia vitripennis]